ncbi:hypothetical protein ACMX0H_000098 [Salmonella enterica subsp. diarizonae]|nr:hypothetical protein [Salmonella enterica]EHN5989770.1 hypothetical protein [Salmonella enterica]EIB2184628.1 hypothetical protein [Salmonella enterica]EJT0289693.1 hypothetical protein [Salmonella enterica]EJU7704547.1 hypothetical protein [Salmonella enterica]
MNFKRYLCQEFIESEVGCSDPTQLHQYKDRIDSLQLSTDKLSDLNNAIRTDSVDVFYKASVSFLESLFSLRRGHSSWAIIKLYYSIFYSLRAFLLLKGYAIFKNGKGEIYFLECIENATPVRISTKKIKGDHKTTIKAFAELCKSHKLNTNTVDSISVFEWAVQCRELVNYRSSSFIEPDYGYEAVPENLRDINRLEGLLASYINDPYYTYCFIEEHSLLATASVLINELIDIFRKDRVSFLTPERNVVLKTIIKKSGLMNVSLLQGLFSNNADILVAEE